MLQLVPPGQCHPEVYPKYLLSTQKWARKKQKKGQKRPKVAKKVILLVKIRPLENGFYAFSPAHLLGPSELVVLHPRTLIGD